MSHQSTDLSSLVRKSNPVFHNDPWNPVLFSPLSKSVILSQEQGTLIDKAVEICTSDSFFAQKLKDSIRAILSATPVPLPVVNSLSPNTGVAGSPHFNLNVIGSGFGVGASILIAGNVVPTTRVSDTELETEVTLESLTEAGSYPVSVQNASGVVSNTQSFEVTAPAPPLLLSKKEKEKDSVVEKVKEGSVKKEERGEK